MVVEWGIKKEEKPFIFGCEIKLKEQRSDTTNDAGLKMNRIIREGVGHVRIAFVQNGKREERHDSLHMCTL
jgi:hypothetical protein